LWNANQLSTEIAAINYARQEDFALAIACQIKTVPHLNSVCMAPALSQNLQDTVIKMMDAREHKHVF